jgi:hypothetical protein
LLERLVFEDFSNDGLLPGSFGLIIAFTRVEVAEVDSAYVLGRVD